MIKKVIRSIKQRLSSLRFFIFGKMLNTNHLKYFVVFVGNNRSGTTLLMSVLNAHPNVVIGNEVHAVKQFEEGDNRFTILGKIILNASRFKKKSKWTGYNYKIDFRGVKSKKKLKIIGDKKAFRTLEMFKNDGTLLIRFLQFLPVPVKFIQCTRHPFDTVTTICLRRKLPISHRLEAYFDFEKSAKKISEIAEKSYFHLFHEELIKKPKLTLTKLCEFLEIEPDNAFLDACSDIIYKNPNKSRHKLNWTSEEKLKAEQLANTIPHLNYYLDEGKLIFDNQKIRQ